MQIVSFEFLLFAAAVTALYFILPKRFQWAVILCGSVVFYAAAGMKYLFYILFMSFVSYAAALRLESTARLSGIAMPALTGEAKTEARAQLLYIKKFICAAAIVCVVGAWVILKYSNFFIENFNALAGRINAAWAIPAAAWVLPLGVSFYTFHIVGYVVDVYRGKYPAERNFAKYLTFVTFFPHIVQGPFSRFDSLGKTLFERHEFSYERLCEGCARILWGVFKKLIVADKLAVAVNMILGNYESYPGAFSIFAVFAYCIELYADFSGYMDIMCGLSHIWGVVLAENFRQPYFAKTIDEFWRRWHITLGAWFKDYVFYPVSMGKTGQKLGRAARKKWGAKMGKLVPGYFALIFVWTATGLWHGANWTYLVWGYLNLLVIMSTMQLTDFYEKLKAKCRINSDSLPWKAFCVLRTFVLVSFFRFFSTQPTLEIAFSTLRHAFFELHPGSFMYPAAFFVGMTSADRYAAVLGIAIMFAVDLLCECGKWNTVKEKCPVILKNVCYASMVILMLLLASGKADISGGFIYANF